MSMLKYSAISLACTGVAATLLGLCAMRASAADDGESSKIRTGYAIAPVPLNLQGKNRALVGLGSYIVNAQGGCSDCHTNGNYLPGGDPFLGQPTVVNQAAYLAGGVAFGPFISRNITPDHNGHPAELTLDEFLTVLNTGIDIDGDPPNVPSVDGDLLQVMPWPVYRHMTQRDKQAIYEYLSAIPCIGDAERCGTD
jgi:hypothetical protein